MAGYFIVTFDDPRKAQKSKASPAAAQSANSKETVSRTTDRQKAEGSINAYIYSVGFKGSIEYDVTAEPVDPNANPVQWSPNTTVSAYLDEDDDSANPLIVNITAEGDAGDVAVDIEVVSVGGSEYDTDSDILTLTL